MYMILVFPNIYFWGLRRSPSSPCLRYGPGWDEWSISI